MYLVGELPCVLESDEERRDDKEIDKTEQVSWCFEQVMTSMIGGLSGVKAELDGVQEKLKQANWSLDE